MSERIRGRFQNRQESQGELATEPPIYHKGDIVRHEEPSGGYQYGIIKKVRSTGTQIQIVTFEIHKDYDIKHQLTGNFVGTTLKIPNTSENLFRMREATPKQHWLLDWLKRR